MNNVGWFILIATVLLYWWHSGRYKGIARNLATVYCQQLSLQLLDQSMVIKGLWIENIRGFGLKIRRRYQFEFSSTGEQRYIGTLILLGETLKSIDLETYKIPNTDPDKE